MAKMAKISKKFLGLSVFCWVLIVIVFLFVTGIVRVSFVFAENFNSGSGAPTASGSSRCKYKNYSEKKCDRRRNCNWEIDDKTGEGRCVCCSRH